MNVIFTKWYSMKWIRVLLFAIATSAGVTTSMSSTAGRAEDDGSPIFGVKIPTGYRDWELIAVAHESGLDELRGVLGNAIAVKAYQDGRLPFPDGTILAKLAWKHVPLTEIDGAFVTGAATTVQIMVKDTKKYATTGGWGSVGSSTANPSTKRSIKRVSLATRPMCRDTTLSLHGSHAED